MVDGEEGEESRAVFCDLGLGVLEVKQTVGPGEGDLRGRSSEGRRRLRDLGHSHGHKRARARANCAHGCARVGLDSARLLCFTRLVVLGALDIGVLLADARDLLVGDLARRLGDLGLAGALVRGG